MPLEVYLLYHVYDAHDGAEEIKLVGVYSSRENAEKAKFRVKEKPGFSTYPDGFQITETRVDQDSWTEGFDTVTWHEE